MLFSLSLIPYKLAMDKLTKKEKGNSLPLSPKNKPQKRARKYQFACSLKNRILFDKCL